MRATRHAHRNLYHLKILLGYFKPEVKNDVIDTTCSTHGVYEKPMQNFGQKT
jgi:hypothetical protein